MTKYKGCKNKRYWCHVLFNANIYSGKLIGGVIVLVLCYQTTIVAPAMLISADVVHQEVAMAESRQPPSNKWIYQKLQFLIVISSKNSYLLDSQASYSQPCVEVGLDKESHFHVEEDGGSSASSYKINKRNSKLILVVTTQLDFLEGASLPFLPLDPFLRGGVISKVLVEF